MEKKTLAEILAENTDEIIRHAKAINELIENTKKAGVIWPELEPPDMYNSGTILEITAEYSDTPHYLQPGAQFVVHSIEDDFYYTENVIGNQFEYQGYIHKSVVKKVEPEVNSFNDVE